MTAFLAPALAADSPRGARRGLEMYFAVVAALTVPSQTIANRADLDSGARRGDDRGA